MKRLYLLIITLIIVACISCEDNTLNTTSKSTLSFTFNTDSLYDGTDIKKINDPLLIINNISKGTLDTIRYSSIDSIVELKIDKGFYTFTFNGTIKDTLLNKTYNVKGYDESVEIKDDNTNLKMALFKSAQHNDFVIAEIFCTGHLTATGKQYVGETYFVFFNNTDKTLYADGLVLMESNFLTVAKRNYTPDIMDTAVAVKALYKISGNGTEHPVEPGGAFLLCDIAINHKERSNKNSEYYVEGKIFPDAFDLSRADMEWYDKSTNPNIYDLDNPDVPNTDKLFCYTLTIWTTHNRGFCSYGIGRIPKGITDSEYLKDYKYNYEYTLVTGSGSYPMVNSSPRYAFPNKWIIDFVNLSIESKFQWIVCNPSLDMGWTWVSKIDHDKTRYGYAIRRKTQRITTDGRLILMDTDNSTEDFIPRIKADPYYFKDKKWKEE